jgi:hypothetical protein
MRIFLVLFLCFCSLHAKELQRLGLFIGNNRGLANEIELRYAERDAEELSRLLVESSTFDEDRIYLLKSKNVLDIKNSFLEINGRVKELKRVGQDVMLLLFYSGHGSADALHINGQKFGKEELVSFFEGVSADLKIMFVDACESGSLLRQKGGAVIETHEIIREKLKSKGSIVITSSARGEFAQESEEYKGAVFTHHLLNALKGAADFNLDRQVSLFEAFEYARNSTRNESILGKTESQNPGFDMNIVGESDVVLANINQKQSNISFKRFPGVMVNIFNAANSKLYSRLYLSGKEEVIYSIPRGRYILSYEDGDAIRAKMLDLAWSTGQIITPADFKKQHKSLLFAKGQQRLSLNPHGLQGGIAWSAPLKTTPALSYLISYIYRSYNWKQSAGFGYSSITESGSINSYITTTSTLYSFEYSANKPVYQHPYGQVLLGAGVGYSSVIQEFADSRPFTQKINDRRANLFRTRLNVEMELYMPMGIWLSTVISPEVSFFKSGHDGKMDNNFYISPAVSVGYQF